MLSRGKCVAHRIHRNGVGDLLSFYCFRWQFLYSSTSTLFFVNYLVDSLGFSKEEATSTYSKLSSRKTTRDPDLVLNFLKQTGFDNSQIKIMVSRAPKLLFSDVSKTLKPKFQCLVDLGLSGSDLVNVIAKNTKIMIIGLDTHMRPTIDCLRRTLVTDENVVTAIKRSPRLLSFGARHIMDTNVLLLKNCGISDARIKKFVLQNPSRVAQNPDRVKYFLHRVEKDFRVPLGSPSFLYAFHVLSAQKKSTLDRKIAMFKSFGWSDDEILELFRKLPLCIALSEVRIEKALNLYMKELSFEPSYLASRPAFLAYSLEKRVIPRMQVLKILDEKKLERRKFIF
ncbi:PREDICTED: transcription termination factor MTERF5, chloroplastic-like [Nicotiana attenuata]|uniref:transcription termination factor MTERF5, chloroplastic-like n=1 Tax=Nicotiana attenuata TaxID=49451 RepID=UPI0009054468|nr:PREDICTED: transcription termination factor MTERF5, chloroplastic-like [Nicotiana attenuata]